MLSGKRDGGRGGDAHKIKNEHLQEKQKPTVNSIPIHCSLAVVPKPYNIYKSFIAETIDFGILS